MSVYGDRFLCADVSVLIDLICSYYVLFCVFIFIFHCYFSVFFIFLCLVLLYVYIMRTLCTISWIIITSYLRVYIMKMKWLDCVVCRTHRTACDWWHYRLCWHLAVTLLICSLNDSSICTSVTAQRQMPSAPDCATSVHHCTAAEMSSTQRL